MDTNLLINDLLTPPANRPAMVQTPPGKQFTKNLWRVEDAMRRLGEREVTVANRRARREASFVRRYGGEHMDALYEAAPELRTATNAMMDRLETAGPTELSQALERRALSDLELDGELTPEDERLALQSARGAFAARGMLYGNQAAVGDVVARQQFADQRRQQRRGFALQVDEQSGRREQNDRSFTSTAFAQLFETLDPYRRVYGAYSVPGGQVGSMNQALDLHRQNSSYNLSTNQMLMDDDFRRTDSALNASVAKDQQEANQKSGVLGAVGQIGGALIGF